jgi:hypothetical protein
MRGARSRASLARGRAWPERREGAAHGSPTEKRNVLERRQLFSRNHVHSKQARRRRTVQPKNFQLPSDVLAVAASTTGSYCLNFERGHNVARWVGLGQYPPSRDADDQTTCAFCVRQPSRLGTSLCCTATRLAHPVARAAGLARSPNVIEALDFSRPPVAADQYEALTDC